MLQQWMADFREIKADLDEVGFVVMSSWLEKDVVLMCDPKRSAAAFWKKLASLRQSMTQKFDQSGRISS